MTTNVVSQLASLVKQEREQILARWRQQVRELPSARELDVPTLNDHIPGLLDELVTALLSKSDETIPEALSNGSPPAHGLQRLQDGFDIEEVVAEYNILRACVHDLADERGLSLQGRPFHIINGVFDHAIGLALQTYSTQRALEVHWSGVSFDLWPLVEALIHDLDPVAGTNSTKLINQVPDDLVVFADAGLLRRVFQNLISNAIKNTPRGEVIIGAKELGAEDCIECWVTDNGAGIPEKLLDKVFDAGETDQEHAGGIGLGLAIVKTFIEAHGGKVTVESKEGAGSSFRFSLATKANVSGQTKR